MATLKGRKIFFIDAIGAIISILFLLYLYSFEKLFGIPKSILIIFICVAIIFSIYSITVYFFNLLNWKFYLTIIAVLNIIFCLFIIYNIFKNLNTITLIGHIYLTAEIFIILILSTYELKLTRKTTNEQTDNRVEGLTARKR